MLYSEDGFSINNESVITSKFSGAKIQPSDSLSKYDKILLNEFYDCQSLDKKTSKIFYEKEDGLHFIINYHEIERARKYLMSDTYSAIEVEENDEVLQESVEEHNETLIEYPELDRLNVKNETETERETDQLLLLRMATKIHEPLLEDNVFDENENNSNNTRANLVTNDDDEKYT